MTLEKNGLFHPANLEDSSKWFLCHTLIGTKKYTSLDKPWNFSDDLAPDWYRRLDEEGREPVWESQENYLARLLEWISDIGISEAYVSGAGESREREVLEKFHVPAEGYFDWSTELCKVIPELNIYNLYLKGDDGSELIVFESDTETVFIHDADQTLPSSLAEPQFKHE